MGSVKVDIHRKQRQYEDTFPMHTAEGVEVFLENFQNLKGARLKGDMDASLLLLDFESTRNTAPLTVREREVLYWRYEREFTLKETAKRLDISMKAVQEYSRRLVLKIADTVAVQEGYRNAPNVD